MSWKPNQNDYKQLFNKINKKQSLYQYNNYPQKDLPLNKDQYKRYMFLKNKNSKTRSEFAEYVSLIKLKQTNQYKVNRKNYNTKTKRRQNYVGYTTDHNRWKKTPQKFSNYKRVSRRFDNTWIYNYDTRNWEIVGTTDPNIINQRQRNNIGARLQRNWRNRPTQPEPAPRRGRGRPKGSKNKKPSFNDMRLREQAHAHVIHPNALQLQPSSRLRGGRRNIKEERINPYQQQFREHMANAPQQAWGPWWPAEGMPKIEHT